LNRNLTVLAALVIAAIALGGNFYVLFVANSQVEENRSLLSSQMSALQSSLTDLQGTASSLRSQLAQLQQSQSSETQAVAASQASLLSITRQIDAVATELNDNVSNYIGFRNQVNYQLQNITIELNLLSRRLNAIVPEVPLSSLTVVGDSYNTANYTFSFRVKNNLNVTVYAQLEAELYGTGGSDCSGIAGSYVSQVYYFPPGSTVSTTLPLPAGSYGGCAGNPITSLSAQYWASQQVRVSPQYTFQISPVYNHA
jgi:hypothetical protein